MARVIISFLGTGGYSDRDNKSRGKYRTANYSINTGKESIIYESEFVSEALYKHYNADRIIYIGTLKSMWEVVYDKKEFVKQTNDERWAQIAEIVVRSNHSTPLSDGDFIVKSFEDTIVTPILVKYGLDKEENEYNIKQLFSIEQLLDQGDELYIDISHSFRSLPIVLTNVLNFIVENSDKDISISNISYGMFEVSNEMKGLTPIVNLSVISELQDNIKAAHELKEYGNAYLFAEQIPLQSKVFNDFTENISINNLAGIQGSVKRMMGLKDDDYSELQKNILPKVIEEIKSRFKNAKIASQFQLAIAKWMFDNKKIGYAYIALSEGIITKICEDKEIDSKKYHNREYAKILVSNSSLKQSKKRLIDRFSKDGKDNAKNEIKNLCEKMDVKLDKEVKEIFLQVSNIRNTVAHQTQINLDIKTSKSLGVKYENRVLKTSEIIKLFPIYISNLNLFFR